MNSQGFTLLELLIVLAIVALLTTIAYPSYNQYLLQSRRTDGQSALLDLANRMEHYYGEHNTYASATIGNGSDDLPDLIDSDVLSNPLSLGQWYLLSITSQDETSFTIQATPQGAQASDIICESLTLNNLGERGITASGTEEPPTGKAEDCW